MPQKEHPETSLTNVVRCVKKFHPNIINYSCSKWPAFNLTSNLDVIRNMDRRFDWGHLLCRPAGDARCWKNPLRCMPLPRWKNLSRQPQREGVSSFGEELRWAARKSLTNEAWHTVTYGLIDWFMMGCWNFTAFWNNPYITKLSRFLIIHSILAKSPRVDWSLLQVNLKLARLVGDLDCVTTTKGNIPGINP